MYSKRNIAEFIFMPCLGLISGGGVFEVFRKAYLQDIQYQHNLYLKCIN